VADVAVAHFSGTLKAWDKKPGEERSLSVLSDASLIKTSLLQELPVLASDYSRCDLDESSLVPGRAQRALAPGRSQFQKFPAEVQRRAKAQGPATALPVF